jgi:hypothetical protein
MAVAFAGMKADSGDDDCTTYAQGEASAEIPLGVMVAQGPTDVKAILMVDGTSKMVGVFVHDHEYPREEMGNTGVLPKNPMAVMRKGRVYVTVEEAVNKNDQAYVRHTASGGNTQKGSFRKSADSATAVICKGCNYGSSAAAGGLAILEVDMNAYIASL